MNSNKNFTEKASNGAFVINDERINTEVEGNNTPQSRTVDLFRHNVESVKTPVDPIRPAGEHMKTPIEIALEMDDEHRVSAKKLYDFLELAPTQYARWCQRNIIDNVLVDENTDYTSIRLNVERGNQATTDYLLTIDFAKELCMTCKTERGRLARNYFKKVEETLVITVQEYNKLKETLNLVVKRVEDTNKRMDELQTAQQENHKLGILNAARIDSISSADLFAKEQEQEWVHEQYENIKLLIKYHPGLNEGDISKGIDIVLWEMEHKGYIGKRYTIEDYASVYKSGHPGAKAYRLAVISEFEDLREGFENSMDELLVTYGAKKKVDLGGILPELDIIDTELESETYEPRRIIDGVSEMEGLNKMYGEGWQERYAKTGEV